MDLNKIAKQIIIERIESRSTSIIIHYRPYQNAPQDSLVVYIDGANPEKLSKDTMKKIVLLALLMDDIAEDIEFENNPGEHGYIHPDGWTASRTTTEMGDNILIIKHRVYESNE